jgi:hypothetical protein
LAHRTKQELERALATILQSPRNNGVLELIVRRPEIDARESLDAGELHVSNGLVGDNWRTILYVTVVVGAWAIAGF